MEMPATASSRTSIDRSSRAGEWMACMAWWVGSAITGSSSNRVWAILSNCPPDGASSPGSDPLQRHVARRSRSLRRAMRSPSRVRLAQLVGLALLAALAVLPVKSALNGALGRDVGFLPAVAAVVVAAGLGGFLPGLVATGVSIVLEAYVFMDPTGRLDVAVESDRVRLLLFGLVGVLASTLALLRDRAQEESHRARAEAELARGWMDLSVRRLGALQGLAAELAGAVTRDHITGALLTHGIASLQADGAAVFVLEAGGNLQAIASRGYEPAREQALALVPLEMPTPATDVARTGEPVYIEDLAEYEARYAASLASRGVAVQPRAVAAVPLAIEGRSFGVLGFTWDSRHEFAADRRTFIAAIAGLGAAALERARLSVGEIGHAAELEAVIGALGEGIIVMEPDGSVRSANPAAGRLLDGRVESLADLLGRLRDSSGRAPHELPRVQRNSSCATDETHRSRWLRIQSPSRRAASLPRRSSYAAT